MKIDADVDSKKKAYLEEILRQAKKNGHFVTTTGNAGQLQDKVQKLRNDAKNASAPGAGIAMQEQEGARGTAQGREEDTRCMCS